MSRTMRKECRKRGISHLEVLFSDEEPFRPRTEAGSSHGGATKLGTASYMPPIMGQMLAGHVIRAIAGLGRARWPGDGRC
jgi:tRNA A37 threonylcarbamoyladenosine dehydratase